MPKLTTLPNWKQQDVFIIGGGSSLAGFDFRQLIGRNTIGCNQAYRLGAAKCNIAIFGDYQFWLDHQQEMEQYDGWVCTNYFEVMNAPSWLNTFQRQDEGLGTGQMLAWNGNTGAAAINLALTLGASRVFLLGFDMGADPIGKTHWHPWHKDVNPNATSPENYRRFGNRIDGIKAVLPSVFPGREIINVTDGSSRLACFPTCSFEDLNLVQHAGDKALQSY